jgi:pyruvate dehydrogenase E1 component alpha subunit
MRNYLIATSILSEKENEKLEKEVKDEITEAVRYASEDCTEPPAEVLYKNIYAGDEIIN